MQKSLNKIIISSEVRPCYVLAVTKDRYKALFHCWTCEREQFGEYSVVKVFALCEFKNGSLKKIAPENIIFADGGEFADTCFVPYDELCRRSNNEC